MRLFSFFILSIFLFSCSNKENTASAVKVKPTTTLIFIDKTSSVDVTNSFVSNKYESTIKEAIEQNIRKEGDKLEIYFIHENTAKGRSLSLSSRTTMDDTAGMNETDLEASKTNYELYIKKEQNAFIRQALNKLYQTNNGNSNKETNISASIKILNAASEGSEVKAYFLSDMIESMKNGRDFHKTPPKDLSQAQSWVEEDITKYNDINLGGIEINMILPFEPTTSSKENNPAVTAYWQGLFESLGCSQVLEY